MEFVKTIPILSIVTYLPLAGALVLLFLKKENVRAVKGTATVFSGAAFVVSLALWFAYDTGASGTGIFQFLEKADWIPSLGAHYSFGMDGIALLLILLTTLLSFIVGLLLIHGHPGAEKEYYALLLLLETGMLGVFCSLDFFLFYLFWEIMLVPMYFLIGVWGGPRKLYAAIKFFLYTLAGSVLMLLGILALYFYDTTGSMGFKGLGNPPSLDILHFHQVGHAHAARTPVLDLPGVLHRVRHQGAHGAVPHLAARRPCGGPHGRLGDPGRGAVEDGHVRLRALLAAHLPRGDVEAHALRSSPCPSSPSSTAPWWPWPRAT